MISNILNKLFYKEAIWGIGACEIENIEDITTLEGKFKQVLSYKDVTDVKAIFLADPFVIKNNNIWYMFFEIYKNEPRKGVIGLATSVDGIKWNYEKVVLEEEFHLSYPYMFEDNGKIYMMPETGESGYIKIYEAINFPYEWTCASNIVRGDYWDSSIFKYDEKWWIFSKSRIPKKNSLSLFYSENLMSGWREHKQSPLITENPRISRPGGRVLVDEGKIIRLAQDHSEYYGKRVFGFEILKLTINEYEEREIGVIIKNSNNKKSWNKDGMHTLEINKNKKGYLLISDGFYYKKVNKITRKIIKNKVLR